MQSLAIRLPAIARVRATTADGRPRPVMMVIAALALALVGTLLVVPSGPAEAAASFTITRHTGTAPGQCSIVVAVTPTTLAQGSMMVRIANNLDWRQGASGKGVLTLTPKAAAPCAGGDHRRVLFSQVKAFIGVAVGLAIGLVASIVLPDLILGLLEGLGYVVSRAAAVAAAQCIGWGVGAIAGEILSGNNVRAALAAGAFACVTGALGGYVKELESVRKVLRAFGKQISERVGAFFAAAVLRVGVAIRDLAAIGLSAATASSEALRISMARAMFLMAFHG